MTPDGPATAALPYRLRFRPQSGPPGAHPGRGEWAEGEFLRHVPLLGQFDPRRIDLLTSLRDPFGGLHLRAFAPRRAVPVILLADLSASMGFGYDGSGLARLAELARLIAASAYESGDSFGLLAAGPDVREDLFLPPARRRGLADEIFARIKASEASGSTAQGLADAVELLPRRRSLVVLVSDFLMPEADLAEILARLWRHEIVPIVMRDKVMEGDLPAFGLAAVRDPETGQARFLLVRPSLRAAWRRKANDRLASLEHMFTEHGLRAFHLVGGLDADALADFLLGA